MQTAEKKAYLKFIIAIIDWVRPLQSFIKKSPMPKSHYAHNL